MYLGFDIGGTKCAVVIGKVNLTGQLEIIDKAVKQTDLPVYDMIEHLFVIAEKLLDVNKSSINEIEGVGINCGGPLNSKTGVILSPPNLPGWDNVPIVELAKKRFGKNVLMQNDANAGAIAEWKYGVGKGYNNLVFLTFGTGMGAGLILDGRLYTGTSDLAGEVGRMRLSDNGPVGFGKAGSFEGWCSGGGLAQLAQSKVRERLQMGEAVSFCRNMEQLGTLTAKCVAEAAFKGDPLAVEIYRICGEYLGRGLSLLIDVLNPELIILGSIYGRTSQLLEPSMMKVLMSESLEGSLKDCRVVAAGLSEAIGDISALCLAVESRQMIYQHVD